MTNEHSHDHGHDHDADQSADMSWTDDGTGKPDWDARYNQSEQIWSGDPNGALVAEVADLAPGRALDVGCGEGADAIWLARQGWTVTALDVSQVALGRARKAAEEIGVEVTWLHSGLEAADLPAGSFDLVSAQYPALLKSDNDDAERALLGAVAPGGTLLFVHHAEFNSEESKAHGFDPDDYLSPTDIAAALGDDWKVQVREVRDRTIAGGSGAHHSRDEVLRAQRA